MILIVDDSPIHRSELARRYAKRAPVLTAQDVPSALEELRSHKRKVRLVICDMLMPTQIDHGKGGLQEDAGFMVLAFVRETFTAKEIPFFVFWTNLNTEERKRLDLKIEAEAAGAKFFGRHQLDDLDEIVDMIFPLEKDV